MDVASVEHWVVQKACQKGAMKDETGAVWKVGHSVERKVEKLDGWQVVKMVAMTVAMLVDR